ncbi:MAG: methyltransferase domain-containing protein [Acidimicrobiales bacterium]|nr:methyltransferase domain-containing protein [Acidimicrobiales bacterium]
MPAPTTDEPETRADRLRRKTLRGVEILITPRLLREQIEYLRHGPAPEPDGDGSGAAAPAEPAAVEPEPEPDPIEPHFGSSPWERAAVPVTDGPGAQCNVCDWTGDRFDGPEHVEGQLCPACGSNGRDRFLFACLIRRNDPRLGATVLETSPRMGAAYRQAMHGWFHYLCSDYDASCHVGEIQLDLQHLGLTDDSVDVIMSPHVLEHVPDTDAALAEIVRALRPGGVLYLQVPILQGTTASPTEPEFHGDNTPVFWRFGFDLAPRLRAAGFAVTTLVTQPLIDVVASGLAVWPGPESPEFDTASMLAAAEVDELTALLDKREAEQLGLWHAYQFVTFECRAS